MVTNNLKTKEMNKLQIKTTNCGGYEDVICNHISRQLPQIEVKNDCTLVEILTNIIYGNKNIRYGSMPSPEFQVTIRKVIRDHIDNNESISVLVPWGSIKADFSSDLDIAELSAIQTLVNLNKQIKEYYSPGLEIVVRIEDYSGYRLFAMENNHSTIMVNSEKYSNKFANLIYLLSDGEIVGRLESEMDGAEQFNEKEALYTQTIYEYLKVTQEPTLDSVGTIPEYHKIRQMGWNGIISAEQRTHYLDQYRKLYKDYDDDRLLKRLAMYFGGSLARHTLDMTGKLPHWDKGFIQLAFIPPVKGLPEGYNHNYVYYRTVPMNQARTHLAPWRAKGYLRIDGRNISNKLSTFFEVPENLISNFITLKKGNISVEIKTDFLLIS